MDVVVEKTIWSYNFYTRFRNSFQKFTMGLLRKCVYPQDEDFRNFLQYFFLVDIKVI